MKALSYLALLVGLSLGLSASSAFAQEPAQPAPEAQPAQGGPAPHGSASPHAAHPHGADPRAVLAPPAMPSAEPVADLPKGTIDIQVLDPRGQPYPGAEIVLGVMASMGSRTERRATSGADGRYRFEDLPTGSQQAYRVNVLYGGAKFSTTPFRLPDEGGYRARVPLSATTQNDGMVFQVIGQTVVELRDDRLHITQQSRLANAGDTVFVLPSDGLLLPLPEGFTAFQWQDLMTDQRGEVVADRGFRLRGSLPPGSVTLGWSFDLPRAGASAKIPVVLPFRTFSYRVISEAPEGLSLRVSDFPAAERVQDEGKALLYTQIQRSPSDPKLDNFSIKLDGIPGPGPGRFFAAAFALLAVAFGLVRAFQSGSDVEERRAEISAQKQALLAQAKLLADEHARGEIGPEYKAERMEEIATELALVLRDEESLPKLAAKRA